jgi:hypothetical protein
MDRGFNCIIRKNGSYYEAIKTATATNAGAVVYGGSNNEGSVDGTDALDVIQAAITNIGGSILIKGNNDVWDVESANEGVQTGWVALANNLNLVFRDVTLKIADGTLALTGARSDYNLFQGNNHHDIRIHMENSWLDGNASGQTSLDLADQFQPFKFFQCYNIIIDGVYAKNWGSNLAVSNTIYLHECYQFHINDVYTENLGGAPVGIDSSYYGDVTNIRAKDWSQTDTGAALVAIYGRFVATEFVNVANVFGEQTIAAAQGNGYALEINALGKDTRYITATNIVGYNMSHAVAIVSSEATDGDGNYRPIHDIAVSNVVATVDDHGVYAPYCNQAGSIKRVHLTNFNIRMTGSTENPLLYAKNAEDCTAKQINLYDGEGKAAEGDGVVRYDTCIDCEFEGKIDNPEEHAISVEDCNGCSFDFTAVDGTNVLDCGIIIYGTSDNNYVNARQIKGYGSVPVNVEVGDHRPNGTIYAFDQDGISLNGGVAYNTIYFAKKKTCIRRIHFYYSVASGPGVPPASTATMRVGSHEGAGVNCFLEVQSEVSKAQGYSKTYEISGMNGADIGATGGYLEAGEALVVGTSDGNNGDTGHINICVEMIELNE